MVPRAFTRFLHRFPQIGRFDITDNQDLLFGMNISQVSIGFLCISQVQQICRNLYFLFLFLAPTNQTERGLWKKYVLVLVAFWLLCLLSGVSVSSNGLRNDLKLLHNLQRQNTRNVQDSDVMFKSYKIGKNKSTPKSKQN